MSNPHADQQTFRSWLVKQLTVLRWSLPMYLSDEETAKRLGVRIDVLQEASALRSAELKKRGAGGVAHGKRRFVSHDYAKIAIRMPTAIRDPWRATCKALRLEPATVFRSLVHHFLLQPARPPHASPTWIYRGEIYRLPHAHEHPPIQTRITRGAQVALDTHADSWNLTPTGLIRGILIEFLEGRTQKLKIVTFAELWGDPDRYLHPEKFR